MLKNFTILFLVLLSFSVFAQDLPEQAGSKTLSLKNKLQTSNINGTVKGRFGTQALYLTLPNNGSTSGNERAPMGTFGFGRAVYLITAAEIAAVGIPSGKNFTEIAWTYAAVGSKADTGSLKVYFQNTSDVTNTKSTTWSTAISTMTLASNSTAIITTIGYLEQPISSPASFTYTGGGLYVAFDFTVTDVVKSSGTAVSANILFIVSSGNCFHKCL